MVTCAIVGRTSTCCAQSSRRLRWRQKPPSEVMWSGGQALASAILYGVTPRTNVELLFDFSLHDDVLAAELSSEARVELLGDVLSTAATPEERRRLAEEEVYGLPSAERQAMLAEIIGTLVEDDRRELLIMLEGDAD